MSVELLCRDVTWAERGPVRGAARRRLAVVASVSIAGLLGAALPTESLAVAVPTVGRSTADPAAVHSGSCPWLSPGPTSPMARATEVVSRMTLEEKIGIIDLVSGHHGFENSTAAVPRLCIPVLSLDDGPNGIAFGTHGVTQLPASIATAATFDPGLASGYGRLLGLEALAKHVDAVQGPDLNLVRVPNSGRSFETFGEDPTLASELGVAEVKGIQSVGAIAVPKHLGVYTQETDRRLLDQIVAPRTMEEVYLAPFRAVIEDAGADSVMCAYGALNAVSTCADPMLYRALASWGLSGFVRSDLGAVPASPVAFRAGLDVVKPAAPDALVRAVTSGAISRTRLDAAVRSVLAVMFRAAVVGERRATRKTMHAIVGPAGAEALTVAERSIVLLRNVDGALPLAPTTPSIAVIGTDGGDGAYTAGQGSAHVLGTPVLPTSAISAAFPESAVSFTPALAARPVATLFSVGTTGALAAVAPQPVGSPRQAPATATAPQGGSDWSAATAAFTPAATSTFVVTMLAKGDAFCRLPNGEELADRGAQLAGSVTAVLHLARGVVYRFGLDWARSAESEPTVTVQDVGPELAQASRAARAAAVAVVFVSSPESEGTDRQSLALPGYEDQLVEAAAAANPDTVVVVNSGGAVLMPWVGRVRAVLEAWYPGQADGSAIAAVLDGAVDPSGRLPVTFPLSDRQSATAAATSWPGVDGTVTLDGSGADGLEIGYRWYADHHVPVLFPFGYGLSYTTFTLSGLRIARERAGYNATVDVTNTGTVVGTEVVEAYLTFPHAAGEPAGELKAFAAVAVGPGATVAVHLVLSRSAFEFYSRGGWRTTSGGYRLAVGDSSADLPLVGTITA